MTSNVSVHDANAATRVLCESPRAGSGRRAPGPALTLCAGWPFPGTVFDPWVRGGEPRAQGRARPCQLWSGREAAGGRTALGDAQTEGPAVPAGCSRALPAPGTCGARREARGRLTARAAGPQLHSQPEATLPQSPFAQSRLSEGWLWGRPTRRWPPACSRDGGFKASPAPSTGKEGAAEGSSGRPG